MRFVEGVAGKGCHFIKYTAGGIRVDAVFNRPRHPFLLGSPDEYLPLLFHHIMLFLGHRAAHQIASGIAVACQVAYDLHHLFLIDHAAVSHVEDGGQLRGVVDDRIRAMLALDVARDGVHRARPVQGDGGNDILEVFRLHVG